MPTPIGARVWVIAVWLALVSAVVAGCGPSEDEIRADINEICVALIDDLSGLDPEPEFRLLARLTDEAASEFGAAAARIEDISTESPADEFATALRALGRAYRDVEDRMTRREYESLAQTRDAGETALADALAAADSTGATDCMGIGVRAAYFVIAADGAAAAAAAMAPTGDYVADVDAACARYAADTFAVALKLNMQSLIDPDTVVPDARDYLDAIEDRLVIVTALDVLAAELAELVPPTDAGAAHARLVASYQGALEGFRSLSDGEGVGEFMSSVRQVEDAAAQLGVDCGV